MLTIGLGSAWSVNKPRQSLFTISFWQHAADRRQDAAWRQLLQPGRHEHCELGHRTTGREERGCFIGWDWASS
uniref:Uncharacterized protein n=1 Tax=Arundo donax TaxID=35708 RepID=A0A0A9APY6_ARUDO